MKPRSCSFDMALDDERPPLPGDLIAGRNVVYAVSECRPVESKVWANRWRVTAVRIGTRAQVVPAIAEHVIDGARWFNMGSYRKGQRPADHFDRIDDRPFEELPHPRFSAWDRRILGLTTVSLADG